MGDLVQDFRRLRDAKGEAVRGEALATKAPSLGGGGEWKFRFIGGFIAGLVAALGTGHSGAWDSWAWYGAFGFALGWPLMGVIRGGVRAARQGGDGPAPVAKRGGFSIWLGKSTGKLAKGGHGAGIAPGRHVKLAQEDAAQNTAIFGGIGSGKTTRAIQPILLQLLDQDAGGLIFDIKNDFKKAVEALATATGRDVVRVGVNQKGLNLLAGLSPEMAASFLKSVFILNGSGKGDGAFWVDTATELCRNGLGVLSFLKGRYSLDALHSYIFTPSLRTAWNDEALALDLGDRDRRRLDAYIHYVEGIFPTFDDKVRNGVNATVSQVLSPFHQPDLVDAFCTDGPTMANMEEVITGRVFLVDLPLAVYGLAAKTVYILIKLRFFNVMQSRNSHPEWNQERPVFFMCDEYQEIVACNKDGLSDLNFWDKSRSSRCVGVISAQSVSSFYAAIGDKSLADAMLQNFRQTICFRTEDEATISRLYRLIGKVEVAKVGESHSSGTSSSGLTGSSSENRGASYSFHLQDVINPQLFRQLGPNEALAVLNIGGMGMDDVIECRPVFV